MKKLLIVSAFALLSCTAEAASESISHARVPRSPKPLSEGLLSVSDNLSFGIHSLTFVEGKLDPGTEKANQVHQWKVDLERISKEIRRSAPSFADLVG